MRAVSQASPPRTFRLLAAASALAVLGLIAAGTWPAKALSPTPASTISLVFTTEATGSPTGMSLGITYRQAGDHGAKPPAVTRIAIELPAGTKVNLGSVPACTASDPEIELVGGSACPASSDVGSGSATLVTGFGAPVDPIRADLQIFNDGSGFIEVFTLPGISQPAVDQRVSVNGDLVSAQVPVIPGGPPDFHTAVRDVSSFFPAADGYVTTPSTCAASREWITTARFNFADGTSQIAGAVSPCRRGS